MLGEWGTEYMRGLRRFFGYTDLFIKEINVMFEFPSDVVFF